MSNLDPRYSGIKDPTGFSKDNPKIKPDGYSRAKSEKIKNLKSEADLIDPYKRDVNHNRKLGIV